MVWNYLILHFKSLIFFVLVFLYTFRKIGGGRLSDPSVTNVTFFLLMKASLIMELTTLFLTIHITWEYYFSNFKPLLCAMLCDPGMTRVVKGVCDICNKSIHFCVQIWTIYSTNIFFFQKYHSKFWNFPMSPRLLKIWSAICSAMDFLESNPSPLLTSLGWCWVSTAWGDLYLQ